MDETSYIGLLPSTKILVKDNLNRSNPLVEQSVSAVVSRWQV